MHCGNKCRVEQKEGGINSAGGPEAGRNILRRSKLFDELKQKPNAASCKPNISDPAAVAAMPGPDVDADGPMSLAVIPHGGQEDDRTKKRCGCRSVYRSKRSKSCVTTIEMPEQERTSHPGCKTTRDLKVLAWSTNQTWISTDDIDWLVRWVADEVSSGGIPVEDPEPAAGLAPNCAAPVIRIRWDFDGAREAIVLDQEPAVAAQNACTPQETKAFVEKLTPEKWAVVDKVHDCGPTFEDATPDQRKRATYHFLGQHMQGVMAKRSAVAG